MFPAHNLDSNGAMIWAAGKSYEKFYTFKNGVLGAKFTFKKLTTLDRRNCNTLMEWILNDCYVLRVTPVGPIGWNAITWKEMKGYGLYENDNYWARFAIHPRS